MVVTVKKKQQLPRSHPLAGVDVTIDDNALISISGRVRDVQTKEPRKLIPLSTRLSLMKLFLQAEHKRLQHPRISVMMSVLSQYYFIPGVIAYLKLIIRSCPTCRRANESTLQQQLGMLPAYRTTPALSAFTYVGIDFAGPFTIQEGSVRKPAKLKVYICLFICLKTRAVYIETCRTIETREFMEKFRKFCNIRGTPSEVFTDNGANFLGAANEVHKIQQLLEKSKEQIINTASQQGIKWHYIPARTPHFGGIWEAGIKAMKQWLKKIISPHPLRQDELEVILADVSAIMNSRPICTLEATELDDDLVLTPGHFLVGRNIQVPPQAAASQAKITNLRRWQLVQRLTQDFWHAWIDQLLLAKFASKVKMAEKTRQPSSARHCVC